MPGILAVHGMPRDDNRYLLERVARSHLVLDAPTAIATRLGVAPALVLCGHCHLPRLPDGPTVLNPGSVGCPACEDPSGDPHVSEAGSRHARYAIVHRSTAAIGTELIAVEYRPSRRFCPGRYAGPSGLCACRGDRLCYAPIRHRLIETGGTTSP